MLFAGIAWTALGLDVAFRDGSSAPAGSPVHFPAGQVSALTDFLRERDRQHGSGLTCVVDSTNGMVDGWLMAAGLRVLRADPWTLPDRPTLGSVDAETLAHVAASRGADLTPLLLASGSLTGRSADQELSSRESEADVAALTASGRCLTAGLRDEEAPVVALTFDDGPNPPVTGRSINLMHDRGGDRSQTAESLPAVIEGLLDRGYRFSRADEMVVHKLAT
jgi:peptidoglycan-N-acetylglucosamine deacetylase